MKAARILLPVFIVVFFASGCASGNRYRYDVSVDAISGKSQFANKNYILVPGMENARITDLEYFEYADHVHRALSKKGYVRTERVQDAGIVIFLAYGISESYTPPEIVLMPGWNYVDSFQPFTNESSKSDNLLSSGSSKLIDLPRDEAGLGGVLTGNLSSALYTRMIILDAFDLDAYRDKRKQVRVWRVKILSTGRTGDLRQLFPIMLAGALDHFGEDSRGAIEQWIYEDDLNLRYMMGH